MRGVMVPLLLLYLSANTLAAESSVLSGEANVSWLKSGGSSASETFKGTLAGKYLHHRWTHELKLEGLNEAEGATGARTSERYLLQEKSSWNFTVRDYLFLKLQAEKDKQSSWDYQTFAALGYGHLFIKTEAMVLSADAGAGVRHNKDALSGDASNEALGNVALKGEWTFRPGARVNEDVSVETGEDSTVVRTRTALSVDLTRVLSLVVAYETKRDDGPADLDDTLTSLALGYRF